MRTFSPFKFLINTVSFLLIASCVVMAVTLSLGVFAPEGLITTDILEKSIGITEFLNNMIFTLLPIQGVLMVGIFVFGFRSLREYGRYYLGAFLSLATFVGTWLYLIYLAARVLTDF